VRPQPSSAGTPRTIAEAHAIGFREIADLNGLEPDSQVPKGTRIKLPPNNEFPQGRTVKIFSDNQTVPKIADEFQVGAMMLAELNGLDYEYDADTNTVKLVVDGDDVPGLLPGEELELPDGAVLIVSPGDTIEAIAETHNVSPTELKRLNPDYLASLADDELIPAERTLVLPANPTWVAQAGDTYELIASLHGIEPAELVAENQGIDLQGTPTVGQVVQLPDDVEYTIQLNDTLAMAASRHQTTADELARLNELDEGPMTRSTPPWSSCCRR
jgi:LysM repeat protein